VVGLVAGDLPVGLRRGKIDHIRQIGYMITPNHRHRLDLFGRPWAVDTGTFSQTGSDLFDLDRYVRCLRDRLPAVKTNVFVTAPDVFNDSAATRLRSLPVLPIIRQIGYRPAYVAQPGSTVANVPWDLIDVLFLGGGNDWQFSESAHRLLQEAKDRGLWVHRGRVNTYAGSRSP
jgi:hypothetical protein